MAVIFCVLPLLAGCLNRTQTPASRIYYHGPVSSHFDGQHFFNPEGESGTGGSRGKGASNFINIATGRSANHGMAAISAG